MRLDPPSSESRSALAEGQWCGLSRTLVSERVGSTFEFPQWVETGPSHHISANAGTAVTRGSITGLDALVYSIRSWRSDAAVFLPPP